MQNQLLRKYDNYLFSLFHNLFLIIRDITRSNYGRCRQLNELNDRLGVIERRCRRHFRSGSGYRRRRLFHHRTWCGNHDRRFRRFRNHRCSTCNRIEKIVMIYMTNYICIYIKHKWKSWQMRYSSVCNTDE